MTLGRKFRPDWEGVLPGKVTLVSNEVPNFNDSVLPTRFVKLDFAVSFLGREDIHLADRLIATELPGIAARCLRAYHRALERGWLIQPASGKKLELAVTKNSDPFTQFVMRTFIPDKNGTVVISTAYAKFEAWCHEQGRVTLLKKVTRQNIRNRIRSIRGFDGVGDGGKPHGEQRLWSGLRLRTKEDRKKDEENEE